jgi:exopolysaccharide biosynthesis protein
VLANVADPSVAASTVLSSGVSTVLNLVRVPHACAAITGTFFAPRSGYPVGDVVVDGDLKVFGNRGSAIAIDYYGRPHVFDTDFGKAVDWKSYRWALRGTVRLVRNGRARPNPKAQGFHDRRIWSRVARTGAGITKGGKLVLIATTSPVTLTQFARAMIKLGVREAVNLDGGSSTCLFYRGVVVIHPARKLSNMLVLTEASSPDSAEQNRESLPRSPT